MHGQWLPFLKKTNATPDFSPLRKRCTELVTRTATGTAAARELSDALAHLESMRSECITPTTLDQASLSKLKQYCRSLRMVHKRVSSSKIDFNWHCSVTKPGGGFFTKDPSVCKGGLGVELIAVLYQMGVCCAAIAARLSEGDEEAKKQSPKWFRNAYCTPPLALTPHSRIKRRPFAGTSCSASRAITLKST